MPSKDIIALLGGWEGYRVGTVARFEAGELSENGSGENSRRLCADMRSQFVGRVRAVLVIKELDVDAVDGGSLRRVFRRSASPDGG